MLNHIYLTVYVYKIRHANICSFFGRQLKKQLIIHKTIKHDSKDNKEVNTEHGRYILPRTHHCLKNPREIFDIGTSVSVCLGHFTLFNCMIT